MNCDCSLLLTHAYNPSTCWVEAGVFWVQDSPQLWSHLGYMRGRSGGGYRRRMRESKHVIAWLWLFLTFSYWFTLISITCVKNMTQLSLIQCCLHIKYFLNLAFQNFWSAWDRHVRSKLFSNHYKNNVDISLQKFATSLYIDR